MELNFDYKEGCYLFNGTNFPEVVIHKTIYKLVTITFQEFGDYKPFGFRVYDLTNKLDIEFLNEKYTKTIAEQDPYESYGIQLGTIVEYDYKDLIFLKLIDKKILSFVLQRPLLFDYIKARDRYLVADALDRVYGLQAEFTANWQQYFITPLESQEKIDWDIKYLPIDLKPNVNENFLKDEFGNTFTDSITVYDFLNVIDTETFNKIPNEELKNQISNLIKKTLEIAKENQAIGKEDPNKKTQEPKIKFLIEATYNKNGEQLVDVEEIEATSEFEALDLGKKNFQDKHEGEKDIELLFVSKVEEKNAVVPIISAEEIFKNAVELKKNRKNKKTQEELSKEIDEADPEDLLSLLNEI
jgi:hypothetical protein